MRVHLLVLPLMLATTPAFAQAAPTADEMRIPPEMNDPAMADRLTDALKVMSGTFLNLPVGEVEAAMQGRPATDADKRRTVRSESGMTETQLRQQLEQSKPMMRASMKALLSALPTMMKGMAGAAKELEKAATNLPQPGYPKQ